MIKKILVSAFALAISTSSFAHDDDGHRDGDHEEPNDTTFTLMEVNDAMLSSLEMLQEADPETAEAVYGFQGSISGDDAKVRFYVREAGRTSRVNYLCHKHDGETECHRQSN